MIKASGAQFTAQTPAVKYCSVLWLLLLGQQVCQSSVLTPSHLLLLCNDGKEFSAVTQSHSLLVSIPTYPGPGRPDLPVPSHPLQLVRGNTKSPQVEPSSTPPWVAENVR